MLHLEHVGIAIPTDPEVIALFQDILSRTAYKTETVESEGVITHFLDAGGAKLEFLTSTDADSAIAKFVERRGPGIHHLAFEVSDIDDAFRRASDHGLRLTSATPTDGADGKRVFFVHPKSASGVLVEFCQSSRPIVHESTQDFAGDSFRVGRAGAPGRPGLLVLSDSMDAAHVDELARAFESTHEVTTIQPTSEAAPPLSRHALRDANIEVGAIVCGVGAGRQLLEEDTVTVIVVFVKTNDQLPEAWSGMSSRDGLLVVCPTEMTARLDELPARSCAFLPGTSGSWTRADLRLAMPLIRHHIAQHTTAGGFATQG